MTPETRETSATPRRMGNSGRSDDPGHKLAAILNGDYNLGIQLPEASLSPAQKDHQARLDAVFRRHNDIINLLRFHYFKGTTHLQLVLDDFDAKAREISSNWVHKPRASRSLLPVSANPPRAPTPEGQALLQNTLLSILETAKVAYNFYFARNRASMLPPAREHASSRVAEWTASKDKGKKVQTLSQNTEQSANAGRSTNSDFNYAADIDRVPVHGRAGDSFLRSDANLHVQNWSRNVSREMSRSSSSSSASTDMFSARDTFEDMFEDTFESQTTVDLGEKIAGKLPQTLRRSLSQESFPISDDLLEAFEETINLTQCSDFTEKKSSDSPSSPDISALADLRLSDPPDELPGLLPAEEVPGLQNRLTSVFPATPDWLDNAPFSIVWEITRISIACGVDLNSISMQYSPSWEDQDEFLKTVKQHPSFAEKGFPERSNQRAWDAALDRQPSPGSPKRAVVYTASLRYNLHFDGPLYWLKLHPLVLDSSHRLSRQFGQDRFLELLLPTHHSDFLAVPRVLRNDGAAVQQINRWLTRQQHRFVGRSWAAFYTKDAGYKKTPPSESSPGERSISINQKRVYLFCGEGHGIPHAPDNDVMDMLDWLLQFNKHPENRNQPYLKLFSRIALGLSRTTPAVVFEPHQLRHRASDVRSGSGKVMNDGIGRMSLSVARKLRTELELSDLPTAVQGRLGSAKGMWILDPQDTGSEDWIETYPSQRKWECDFDDINQRTLEVRNYASEAHSASLNLQFLPLLEDRAVDKTRMRQVLGSILEGSLSRDMERQKEALNHPLLFLAWVHENSRYKGERARHGEVPFLGGLPDRDEETIQFLLAGGFQPKEQMMVWNIAYKMQAQKYKRLKEKLNVRVGRTAYLYMVVDFWGILEEGEVQVCFSSKFQADADAEPDENGDDGSFSDTLLTDRDVLVARAPAHFASDMQKVRAVFRPELCALKDVIIFSSKGSSPLADKLSGGDYDGDMAWVCWDPRIVDNFANAPDPPKYDLVKMGYMRKIRTTLDELMPRAAPANVPLAVVGDMIERSFEFSMKDNLLGQLTNYKEDLCYARCKIDDKTAVILSTLLGELVDQAKQGTDFTKRDFERLRVECLEGIKGKAPPPAKLPKPAFKGKISRRKGELFRHITDYLMFSVARPLIEKEMQELHDNRLTAGKDGGRRPEWFDPDLAKLAEEFEKLAQSSEVCRVILKALKADIEDVQEQWETSLGEWKQSKAVKSSRLGKRSPDMEEPGYRDRFLRVYEQWNQIGMRLPEGLVAESSGPAPKATTQASGRPSNNDAETILRLLQQKYLADSEYSQWALIRASQTFRTLSKSRHFVFQLAGRQLQVIKALMVKRKGAGGGVEGARVMMTAAGYVTSRPDSKVIKRIADRLSGTDADDSSGEDYDGYDDT